MQGLELKNLEKHYSGNEQPTIRQFSAKFKPGEFVVLVGPSGCGKSTLLRMIAGLVPVSNGAINLDGEDITNVESNLRNISMVFQNYALFPHMNVYENLAFGMRIRKEPARKIEKTVTEAAKILHLQDLLDKKPGALSGGQRQRVALGRAFVRKPKVILFDEPLSNLDARLRIEMRQEILKFHEQCGAISIYVTHDQHEAMTMADRMIILNQGVACQTGTPEEVYNNPVDQFVAGFVGSIPMNFIHGRGILNEGRSFFQLGSYKIDLSHIGTDYQLDWSKNSGGLILGVRPEDIYLDEHYSNAVAPSPKMAAQVKMVEYLGDSTIVHLEGEIGSFKSRFNKDLRVRKSQKLDFVFDLKKLHLFTEEGNKLPC